MRKYITYILLCLCGFALADETAGQRPLITESMPNVVVHQDSAITRLLRDKIDGIQRGKTEVAGYRVQIFSSNRQQQAKQEAMQLEKTMMTQISEPIYVQYAPPFWKVRIGNFRTQEEALAYKNHFLENHPELIGDTYVVRDQIEIVQ